MSTPNAKLKVFSTDTQPENLIAEKFRVDLIKSNPCSVLQNPAGLLLTLSLHNSHCAEKLMEI